jgi:hypothetical protein
MHIQIPDGDVLIPDSEFASLLDGVTRRTLSNYDRAGLPFVRIGGKKYRPRNEGLAWIASRIQRRNPHRIHGRQSEAASSSVG